MVDDTEDDAALDALFSAAKASPPEVSQNFLEQLNAEADASLPRPVTTPTPIQPPWVGKLKGLFAASGLSGAAVLGIWIGFVMPETISTFTQTSDEMIGLYIFLPGADLTAPDLSE